MDSGALGDLYLNPGNGFLRMMQALIQGNVINLTTTVPPVSPANGDTYVVAAGATGVWAGKDKNIAYWTTRNLSFPTGSWDFYPPLSGWNVYNDADGLFYYYNGSSWVAVAGGLASGSNIVPGNWFSGFNSDSRNTSLFCLISAGATLQNPVSSFKLVFNAHGASGVGPMVVGQMLIQKVARAQAAVQSTTAVTIGGSGTPSIAISGTAHAQQEIVSDVVNLTLDNAHDYWFAIFWADVASNSAWSKPACPASLMPTFKFINGGNNISTNPIPFPAGGLGTGSSGEFVSRIIVP
jgi:hypothetical protein